MVNLRKTGETTVNNLATLPPDQSTEGSLPHRPSTVALPRVQLYLGRSLLTQLGASSWESDLSQSASEWSCSPAPLIAMRWYRLSMSGWYEQKQWQRDKTRMEMATFGVWFMFSLIFFGMELSEPHPQTLHFVHRSAQMFSKIYHAKRTPIGQQSQGTHTQQGAMQWTISGRES